MAGKNPQLVLQLGDYSYQSKATCWFNIIKPIDSKSKINIGNHDDESKSLLNSYLNHFHLKKPYYSFNFENVHFLILNTEDTKLKKTSSAQYEFAENDLKSASKDANIGWIIVSLHKPLFTSPNGCRAGSCMGSLSFTKALQPLFYKYHADLVLEGHVHNYQRTFPLKFNSANPLKPTKTSTATNDYIDPTGQIYAIVGTGGINFHSLNGKASFVSSQQAMKFGILDIKITDDGNKLSGTFYPNGGGSSMDHFSITKSFKLGHTNQPGSIISDPFSWLAICWAKNR
ncbi:MAG TPA: metallophosphoesterase [Nitrososphaeraceae archaeon]